ncbi:flagellar hook-basal body complex protein [Mucisphaera calidilacus]|uniref:Flagellar basal-body rod protein FlgG n=1 Tax=Mucisphaera calidilacus TaxID=2527982 RepID=A0A518BZH9_9BACT|nr:flagellar hook basal-body protein [Mucisphaera calidilacus]QDU72369.1 Flagellar basal-body rod protein FlgG [Mucisphaera calidilacus]
MNYGLYLSTSGLLTNMYRQDVFANNLANVATTGFKPVVPEIMQRDPERIEDGFGPDVAHHLLERLGGGVLAAPQRVSFARGQAEETGRGLDVMLGEEDQFFAVEDVDAETGEAGFLLTRAGNFSINHLGELVTVNGRRVLNQGDRPIYLSESPNTEINDIGEIVQDGEVVDQIQVMRVTNKSEITMAGGNLMRLQDPEAREILAEPYVRSGYLETSGVNMFHALMRVTQATKSANSNSNMIRYHDMVMDRAVNTFGRVA